MSPTSKSSYTRPVQPYLSAMRWSSFLNDLCFSPSSDRIVSKSKFLQDGVCMLAQCGNRAHHWLNVFHRHRRNQSAQRSDRRIYITPSSSRSQLRMVHKLLHCVQSGISNLRDFQTCDDLHGSKFFKPRIDDSVQRGPILHTQGIGDKTWIVLEPWLPQNFVEEEPPLPLILHRQDNFFAITAH